MFFWKNCEVLFIFKNWFSFLLGPSLGRLSSVWFWWNNFVIEALKRSVLVPHHHLLNMFRDFIQCFFHGKVSEGWQISVQQLFCQPLNLYFLHNFSAIKSSLSLFPFLFEFIIFQFLSEASTWLLWFTHLSEFLLSCGNRKTLFEILHLQSILTVYSIPQLFCFERTNFFCWGIVR